MRKIKGGYYLKARCIQNSKIAIAPPHIREIWDWLLKEANHKDTDICQRGQCIRSYKDIQEGLSWYQGWRKHKYNKQHCEIAMKWLKKATMITTMKTTRGMCLNIINYNLYQDPKNYESHNENHTKATRKPQSSHTINKKEKNVKNVKNKDILAKFNSLWNKYPDKDGKKDALRHFTASVNSPKDWDNINTALVNYLQSDRVKNGFIKKGSTFFNGWQDWVDFKGTKPKRAEPKPETPEQIKKRGQREEEARKENHRKMLKRWEGMPVEELRKEYKTMEIFGAKIAPSEELKEIIVKKEKK